MVKLINNVPCAHTDKFNTDMEFILLHKILDNKKYKNFHIRNGAVSKYKILDNGAYELGKSLDMNKLLEWAKKLRVNEVIAPDKFGDENATLKMLFDFIRACPENFKIQAVPQGKNQKELLSCLNAMLLLPRVDVIGFNKLWDRHSLLFNEAVKRAYSYGKEIHLLGVNCLKDWLEIYKNSYIRSADSRILSKIVSGQDNTWEVILDNDQLRILEALHKEVAQWQK